MEINNLQDRESKIELYNSRVIPIKNEIARLFEEIHGYIDPLLTAIYKEEEQHLASISSTYAQVEKLLADFESIVDSEMVEAIENAHNMQR